MRDSSTIEILGDAFTEAGLQRRAVERPEGQDGDRRAQPLRQRHGRAGRIAVGAIKRELVGIEEVAAARQRADQRATGRAEGAADVGDALHQAVVGYGDAVPDDLYQLVLAHDTAGVGGEVPQHGKGLRTRAGLRAVGSDDEFPIEVDPEAADLERFRHFASAARRHGTSFAT